MAVAIGWRRRRPTGLRWSRAITLIALTIPHLAVVVLGDSVEISRHALTLNVIFASALLLILVFLIDDQLSQRRSFHRKGGRSEA